MTSNIDVKENIALNISLNRITGVVACGQKCGEKSASVLRSVCDTWMNYMLVHHKSLEDTFELAETSIDAVAAANKATQKDQVDIHDWQQVSLLGCICCRLPSLAGKGEWFLICTSIGKIKAFAWNATSRTLVDICTHREESENLTIFSHVVKEEDTFILVMSPGAYLHAYPCVLGRKPRDFNLPHKNWDKLDEDRARMTRENIADILSTTTSLNSEIYVETLVNAIKEKADKRREYLHSKNTSSNNNSDTYDQATILCFDLGLSPTSLSSLPPLGSFRIMTERDNKSEREDDRSDPLPPTYIPGSPKERSRRDKGKERDDSAKEDE